jgi:hypothetical protein
MLRTTRQRLLFIAGLWIAPWILAQDGAQPPEPKSVPPLTRAHAHNDYEHARPLFDALERGFCSVEADIWLVDGRLLVAHDRSQARPERTLEALYLDPLRSRVRANGGRAYPNGPGILLLVDVKSDAESTYAALRDVLKGYAEMLTEYRNGAVITNAVTVVISGNRAVKTLAAEPQRYAFIDGRMPDLENGQPASLIPLVSDNWSQVFQWHWSGPMPDAERQKLKRLTDKTHAQGRRLRFWATPDRPEAWKVLYDAGVDLINTDDLEGLRKFLGEQPSR